MADNQVNIAINLQDFVTKPLEAIFSGIKSVKENLSNLTGKFSQFAKKGSVSSEKVEKSLEDLEAELKQLKEQKAFEKDIERVEELNRQIEELENKINGLKRQKKGLGGLFDDNSLLGYAAHLNAIADSFDSLAEALDFTGELGEIKNLLAQIGENSPKTVKEVYRLSQVYGDSFDEIIQAANAMTKNLGGSFEENLKIIEEGYRKGANLNQNMLDQLREYPSALKGLKITGKELVAVMTQANKAGVWDDKMLDTIKEAYNQLTQLTDDKINILKSIGLDPGEIEKKINQGQILDVLKEISVRTKQLSATGQRQVFSGLFSSLGEDTQGILMEFDKFSLSLDQIDEKTTAWQKRIWDFKGLFANLKSWLGNAIANYTPFIQFTAQSLALVTSFAPALATFRKGLTVLTSSFKIIVPQIIRFGAALLASPITWIIGGIVALGVAIYMLIKHWDKVKKAFQSAFAWIKKHLGGLIKWWLKIEFWPFSLLFKLFPKLKGWFRKAYLWFKQYVIDPIVKFFKKVIDGIKKIASWFKGKKQSTSTYSPTPTQTQTQTTDQQKSFIPNKPVQPIDLSDTVQNAKIYRININFDQDFTIRQEMDWQEAKQRIEQIVISAVQDAELMMQ